MGIPASTPSVDTPQLTSPPLANSAQPFEPWRKAVTPAERNGTRAHLRPILLRPSLPNSLSAIHRSNRLRTAEETKRLLDLHVLPRWRSRLAREITRRDVLDVLDRVFESGKPIAANRTLAAIRKMFNWAVARDMLTASPCTGVKPPTVERARDRVLSDDELKLIWQAARKVGGSFGSLVQLLMLIGQRRNEVSEMQWGELDLEVRLWTLPRERVKTDQPHEVPLSGPVIAVLETVPRIADSLFVLTTTGVTPSNGFSKGKRRIRRLVASGYASVAAARFTPNGSERHGEARYRPAGDRKGVEP